MLVVECLNKAAWVVECLNKAAWVVECLNKAAWVVEWLKGCLPGCKHWKVQACLRSDQGKNREKHESLMRQ